MTDEINYGFIPIMESYAIAKENEAVLSVIDLKPSLIHAIK